MVGWAALLGVVEAAAAQWRGEAAAAAAVGEAAAAARGLCSESPPPSS